MIVQDLKDTIGDRGREAVAWMVAFTSGEMTSDQAKEFERWRGMDPRNAEAWAIMSGGLNAFAVVARSGIDSRSVFKSGSQPASRRSLIKGIVATAGVAAVSGMIGDRFVPMSDLFADHVTRTAQQKRFVMEDGSVLTLGPRSAVNVTMTDDRREVHLIDGDLFVDVMSDVRPFAVRVGLIVLESDAGRFTIKRRSGRNVLCAMKGEGRVLRGDDKPLSLSSGDQMTFIGDRMERMVVDPETEAAWTKGLLVVADTSLEDIVERFRPYYQGVIRLEDSISQRRATAVLDLFDPAQSLRTLSQSLRCKASVYGAFYISIAESLA